MNSGAMGKARAAIGNLAPWNYTRLELDDSNYSVYGMAVSIMNDNDQFPLIDFTEIETQSLSSESSDAVKTKYRTEHDLGDIVINEEAKLWLFNELKNGATLQLPAILRLVKTLTADHKAATFIDTSNLVRQKGGSITGVFDPNEGKDTDSHWRTVIDDQIRRTYVTNVPIGTESPSRTWTDVHIGIMGVMTSGAVANNIYARTVFGSTQYDTTNRIISIPFLPCKKQSERVSTVGMNILALRDTNITSTGGRTNEFKFVVVFEAYTYDADSKQITAFKFGCRRCIKYLDMPQSIKSAMGPVGNCVIKFDQSSTASEKYSEFSKTAFDWDGANSTWQWSQGDTYKRLDYYVNFAMIEASMLNRSNGQPSQTPSETTLSDNTTVVAHIYSADNADKAHFISGLVNKGDNSIASSRWLPTSQAIVQFYSSSGIVGNALFFPKQSEIMEQSSTSEQVIFSHYCCKYQYSSTGGWTKVNDSVWPNPTLRVYKMKDNETTPLLVATISSWTSSGTVYQGSNQNISARVLVGQTYEGRYRSPDGNYHYNDGYFFLVTISDTTNNEYRNGYTYYIDFATN